MKLQQEAKPRSAGFEETLREASPQVRELAVRTKALLTSALREW